jgi:16S rRNA (adenine1518-N6/adenine1519-N6)-dimethyltransferase
MPKEIPILPDANAPPEPAPPPPPAEPLPLGNRAPPPRQTLGYLRGLMQSHGLEPKAKLGQNFLIDLNLLDLICRAAELNPLDAVLEVGTGTGSLTALMADRAGCVCSVEIDPDFHRLASEIVGDRPNVRLVQGDALARKNELNPDALRVWDELATRFDSRHRKLVANLPYVVATPVITNLLIHGPAVERVVAMVQWEIGERLRATVGTKDYNSLSVLVQSVADVETVRKVLPANFFPRPKVDSAIVLIKPNAAKRARVGDVARFRAFLRDLYTLRRKNLRGALAGRPGATESKSEVDAKLKALGFDGNTRAETLTVEQHLELSRAFG